MANVAAERDFDRAKELRKLSKSVQSSTARSIIESAAARLEARGARKLNKIGRIAKKKASQPV